MNMSEMEMIAKLVEAIEKLQQPAIPVAVDLWDAANIAQYLKRSVNRVRNDIVCLPTFPRPIRLPAAGPGRAHALYKAREVIAWAEKQTS